jgi:hypothetical protein
MAYCLRYSRLGWRRSSRTNSQMKPTVKASKMALGRIMVRNISGESQRTVPLTVPAAIAPVVEAGHIEDRN